MRKEVSIPSSTEFLSEVRKEVSSCVSDSGFDEAEANRIVVAVDEALTNVIEHAYASDLEGECQIDIALEADEGKFSAEIRDRGTAFDPTCVSLPNIREHVRKGKRSGLGIFLMRRIMDEVEYSSANGVNVLRMVKYAPRGHAGGKGDA